MVATGQEIVREKNSSRSGKSQGKFTSLKKVREKWNFKSTNLFQGHDTCWISRILFHLIERQADVKFPRKSILFPCYVKELSIHVNRVCLAESITKWVKRMAVRGGWRPLSGLICEIVNSVGQGNFTFVREKSGNFKHLWLWQPCFDSALVNRMFLVFFTS